MLKNGYIDEKTNNALYKPTVNLDDFTFNLKYTNPATRDVPSVVSSHSHPTVRISQLFYFHINPLVSSFDLHIKNTTDSLNKLSNLATNNA